MDVVADVLSWLFIATGLFFMLVGAIGIMRMPDVFTRLHAAGMTDTMGAGSMRTDWWEPTGHWHEERQVKHDGAQGRLEHLVA